MQSQRSTEITVYMYKGDSRSVALIYLFLIVFTDGLGFSHFWLPICLIKLNLYTINDLYDLFDILSFIKSIQNPSNHFGIPANFYQNSKPLKFNTIII